MCSSADEVHENMEGLHVCSKCGYRTDFFYINRKFRVSRRVYDLSCTYDGYTIVSRKFKEFCDRKEYKYIEFKEFDKDYDFFALFPVNVVEYDTDRNKPQYENYCESCGNYESVIGPSPIYLKGVTEPLADGFYRTDIMFASGNEKSPLIIIGPETKETILKEGFKNIYFEKIIG